MPVNENLSAKQAHARIHIHHVHINRSRVITCLVAGLITFIILLISLAVNHIYPFGDTSIAVYDLEWQYQSYFGWLSNVLHGQSNLFYSNAKGLGGGMLTLFAYYLSSPFNVLAILFSPAQTPELISLLTLIKLPTCAITCAVFLTGRFADHINAISDQLILVLISTAYALCGCVGGYSSNLMWIDGYYMLPLVALGIYRLVTEKKVGPLFCAVLFSILFNWYTAYMNCLFAILYFFFELLRHNAWSFRIHTKKLLRMCGRFIFVMALAVGTSMVLLWPNIVEQLEGKGANAGLATLFTQLPINSELYTMWSQFCVGSTPSNEACQAPVYIASIVVLLSLVFLFARGYRKSDRKAYLVMCIIGVASTVSPFLSTIWTGFFPASSYIDRQAYVFSFFLVIMAFEGWTVVRHADRNNVRSALIAAVVGELGVIALSIAITRVLHPDLAISWQHYAATVVVVLLCSLFIYFFSNLYKKIQALAQREMMRGMHGVESSRLSIQTRSVAQRTILIMCLGLGAFIGIESVQTHYYFSNQQASVSFYESYMSQMSDVLSELPTEEGFLRVEQTGMSHHTEMNRNLYDISKNNANDDMLALNISSPMHYSSTQNNNEQNFFAHVGYTKQSIFGTYARSPIEPIDKLLGIDYVIDNRSVPGAQKIDADLPQPSDQTTPGFSLYQYQSTMPLGYGVANNADLGWDQKDTRLIADPFADQTELFSELTGQDATDLYHRDAIQETNPSTNQRSFDVTITQDGPAYLKLSSNMNADHYNGGILCNVSVNGQFLQCSGGRFSSGVIYLGTYYTGDVVHVQLDMLHNSQSSLEAEKEKQWFMDPPIDELVHVESLNEQKTDQLLNSLDSNGFQLNSYSDGNIDATFNADHDELLMLSVPYDLGWNATVDGENTSIQTIANTFCGIHVHAGTNHIQLHYHTPGLYAGACIAAISLIIFAIWQLCATYRRRQKRLAINEI